jgi:hypothetical protein
VNPLRLVIPLLTVFGCLFASSAWAETLQVPVDAPWWAHLGATTILIVHIAGGAIGILTGWIASASKKGQKLHRISGQTFFVAMFVSYLIAACVAPFLDDGARPNTVAGILALYLLLSGVAAARRRQFKASQAERMGLLVALFTTAIGAWFAFESHQDPAGSLDGSPPEAFAVFIITGCFAIFGEVRVLMRGRLSNAERVKRHLWRMCASFFIASGSFFVGQPQIFPVWFNETPLPDLLSFAPIIIMIYFLVRYGRTPKRFAPAGSLT